MAFLKKAPICCILMGLMIAVGTLLSGCGNEQQQTNAAVSVKAMKVLQQDTPLSIEYASQIKGKDEIKIQPKVTGTIVEKYIKGGQYVQAGQPLYKIDSRQYESAVLSAEAAVEQSEATLNNSRIDLSRYTQLVKTGAVSEQTVTTQEANVKSYQGAYNNNVALLKKAQENLDDTVIYAPVSGRLSVDDVAAGGYATAGSTSLVTLGTTNPIYAQFSISENEYLKYLSFRSDESDMSNDCDDTNVQAALILGNGKVYPYKTNIVEIDRALSDNTGTLTIKALFDNPEGDLIPGMFARIRITGTTIPNAILVPQRAVQQLLDKSFVIVVGSDNTSISKNVTLGSKIGSYYVIKNGLSADDIVVVEGLTNLQEGQLMNVTMVTPEEMKFSLISDAVKPMEGITASSSSKM